MALIVVMSATGSPGVTTSAVALALAWPRPVVLVEADPSGSSGVLAGYLRGELAHEGGLIDLAMAHRQGGLGGALPRALMAIPDSGVQFLPGVRGHDQARSLTGVWEPLAAALRGLDRQGQDVIVDAGRLGLAGSPMPMVAAADVALLVCRSSLPALAGARSWAAALREEFTHPGAPTALGVVLVGSGRPYRAREVSRVLGVPVVAELDWDPDSARVFSDGASPPRRFERRALPRSVRAAVTGVQAIVAATAPQPPVAARAASAVGDRGTA